MSSLNTWSRFLGVSLRPWSGQSPISLLLRGIIHTGICIFFLVLFYRMLNRDTATSGTQGELAFLNDLSTPVTIVLVVLAGIGLVKIVVGVLDLVPRQTFTGTVVSVRERKAGDFLPYIAQRALYERGRNPNEHTHDNRKQRTEVVIQTPEGIRQWTVRSHKVRRQLQVGSYVQVSVTPLAGYVAKVSEM